MFNEPFYRLVVDDLTVVSFGNWAKIKEYLSVALTDKEYWDNIHVLRDEEPVYISGKKLQLDLIGE